MRQKTTLLIVFLALLFTGFSSAVSTDFSASTQYSSYSQCSCEDVIFKVDVDNTGDFESNFFISFQGDLKEFASIYPTFLHLKPAEKGYFMVFVKLPCNWYGEKKLTTIVTSDINVRKGFTQTFDIQKCQNIEANITILPEQGCRCSKFNYKILLKNPGKYEEIYSFDVKDVEDSVLPASVTIKPNETREIEVGIAPKCGFTGGDIDFKISTYYTKQEKILKLPVNINKDCSAKELKRLSTTAIIIIAGVAFILLVILLLVLIFRNRGKAKEVSARPRVISLETERKPIKWPKYLFILFFILIIAAAAYAGYVYVPKLFAGAANNTVITPTEPVIPVEPSGVNGLFNLFGLGYWFYVIIGVILLVIMLIIAWFAGSRQGSFLRFIFKLFMTLLILGIIGCIAWLGFSYWNQILPFIKIYWMYIAIGVILLVFLIIAANIIGRKKQSEEAEMQAEEDNAAFICEFCGKEYKSQKGLENHRKKVHSA